MIHRFGDMPTTRTEYVCGPNVRIENSSCLGHSTTTSPTSIRYEYGPLRAHISNRDMGYRFEIEPAACVYAAFRMKEDGRPSWNQPALGESRQSGNTIHDHTETIDTGERKELFGYTARRVLTRSRQVGDSQLLMETECDGWYIDPPSAWRNLPPPPKTGMFFRLSSGNGERDEYKFTEAGERETGFVVRATRIHRSFARDETGNPRVHESVYREEVSEFSETPLELSFFVPPRDFKRLPQLPDGTRYRLAYRARLRWEMWKDSLTLPKRIAEFTLDSVVGSGPRSNYR